MAASLPIIITIPAVTVAIVSVIVITRSSPVIPIIVVGVSVAAVAPLVRFAPFVTPVIGLTAVVAMVLYGFTQLVFLFRYAPLAIVTTCSLRTRRGPRKKSKHLAPP